MRVVWSKLSQFTTAKNPFSLSLSKACTFFYRGGLKEMRPSGSEAVA
jgi:hypothetical protein